MFLVVKSSHAMQSECGTPLLGSIHILLLNHISTNFFDPLVILPPNCHVRSFTGSHMQMLKPGQVATVGTVCFGTNIYNTYLKVTGQKINMDIRQIFFGTNSYLISSLYFTVVAHLGPELPKPKSMFLPFTCVTLQVFPEQTSYASVPLGRGSVITTSDDDLEYSRAISAIRKWKLVLSLLGT